MTYTHSKRYVRYFTSFLFMLTFLSAQAQYCEPSGGINTSDDWLAGVQFSNINNSSGSTVYSDFTDIIGTVEPGVSYEFTGTIGNNADWEQYLTVYIDFNQDYVFDELTERFDLGTCNSNDCTVSGDITIPEDAVPGATRMRVIENYNDYTTNACEQSVYSEVEDYTIFIIGDCIPPIFNFEITQDCETNTFDVEATLSDFGGNSTVTIHLNRSDIGDLESLTLTDDMVGQTINVISDVPLGVVVTATVESVDPQCTIFRVWDPEVICAPVNNECENSITLSGWETVEGTTLNATPKPYGINFCGGLSSSSSPAVWYKYTVTEYSGITVSLSSSDYNSRFYVYEGICGDLNCMYGSNGEATTWLTTAGYEYYIMVTGSSSGESGGFELNIEVTGFPACAYPTLITTMVDENGDEIEDCLQPGDTYFVEVAMTHWDDVSYYVSIESLFTTMGSNETQIFGPFDAGINTEIDLIPHPPYAEFCSIHDIVESNLCPSLNDECVDATPLECGDYVIGHNIDASPSVGCNGNLRRTVWYSYTAEVDGSMFLSTCNPETNFDSDISMYTGSCNGELECFDGWSGDGYNDGNSGCTYQGFASEGSFDAVAGETYYIAVSGFSLAESGEFGLSLNCLGSASLEGSLVWDAACGEKTISVNFYNPDTDEIASSHSAMVSPDGTFYIPNVDIGSFDVVIKVDGFLAVQSENFEVSEGPNFIPLPEMTAGDINGDNAIHILDVSLMNAAFGSSIGDDNYNELADSNCDGSVNIQDVSAINAGFGQSGASVPLP